MPFRRKGLSRTTRARSSALRTTTGTSILNFLRTAAASTAGNFATRGFGAENTTFPLWM